MMSAIDLAMGLVGVTVAGCSCCCSGTKFLPIRGLALAFGTGGGCLWESKLVREALKRRARDVDMVRIWVVGIREVGEAILNSIMLLYLDAEALKKQIAD